MKTPTSSESGYFHLRISVASLLCICGVWLAAMSFVPSASAWSANSGGTPGYVTWTANVNVPVIAMGYNSPGSADFTLSRVPTIGMSPSGTDWQYATVTIWVYYYCAGEWCLWDKNTTTTPTWTYRGATATVDKPRVSPIPTTGTAYWTSLIQIIWYNDMRYSSSQWAAWETFYPTNTGTTSFDYVSGGDPPGYQWHGNAELAIASYAEKYGAGQPWGPVWSSNLYSPTGYIYVLQGLKNN